MQYANILYSNIYYKYNYMYTVLTRFLSMVMFLLHNKTWRQPNRLSKEFILN